MNEWHGLLHRGEDRQNTVRIRISSHSFSTAHVPNPHYLCCVYPVCGFIVACVILFRSFFFLFFSLFGSVDLVCCAVLCYAMLCYAVLCYAVLYCAYIIVVLCVVACYNCGMPVWYWCWWKVLGILLLLLLTPFFLPSRIVVCVLLLLLLLLLLPWHAPSQGIVKS